jgi:hypothetical protein
MSAVTWRSVYFPIPAVVGFWDGGVPPGRPGWAGFLEPVMGEGPKSTVVACDADLVHEVPGPGYQWRIWRY